MASSSIDEFTILSWADCLATYVLWAMMDYLTEVWKISFVHAAGIVNIFSGIVLMLQLPIQYLVDTITGDYLMLLLSGFAYSAGMVLLTMSAGAMATSSEYIGEGQKIQFYIALGFIAFGRSCHSALLEEFIAERIMNSIAEQTSMPPGKQLCFRSCEAFLVPITIVIAISYIEHWEIKFGISAACSVVATIIFIIGSCSSYRHRKPPGSPLTTVFRVLVASTSKIFYRFPRNASELYERNDLHIVPRTHSLRCLDKAAILLPNKTLEQQERNKWRLCRVTEVEETKGLLRIIPICLTFIIPGVVSSIGNSYFVEQADTLTGEVGKISVASVILLPLYDKANKAFTCIYVSFFVCFVLMGRKKYTPVLGFVMSTVLAILCCITAAKVETRRLDVIRSHGLIDKPDEKIPMSIFWLVPQFLLLGGFDGIREKSIDDLLKDQCPSSLVKYGKHISASTTGLGIIGDVLSVYLVGIISESIGKHNWFQDTVNKSRLDNYYWVLAALTAANLVVFILVAKLVPLKEPNMENYLPLAAAADDDDDDDD